MKVLIILVVSMIVIFGCKKHSDYKTSDDTTASKESPPALTPTNNTDTIVPSIVAKGIGPPLPVIEYNVCPFEGCQFGRWKTQSPLRVFARENDTAGIAFTLAPGDSFTALTGNIHMERLGTVIVTRDTGQFKRGDTVYTLSYTGEGWYDVWYKGQMPWIEMFWSTDFDDRTQKFDIDDTLWNDVAGVLVHRALMIWWVRIRLTNGQEGWLRLVNTTDNGFSIEERIDGMDMLG
jgi:hypothetical protein